MSKFAIIADDDITGLFSSFGFEGFSVSDKDAARKALSRVAEGDYSICYITEFFAEGLLKEIKDISQERLFPVITIISDHKQKLGIAADKLRFATIKAVGSEALVSEKKVAEA